MEQVDTMQEDLQYGVSDLYAGELGLDQVKLYVEELAQNFTYTQKKLQYGVGKHYAGEPAVWSK